MIYFVAQVVPYFVAQLGKDLKISNFKIPVESFVLIGGHRGSHKIIFNKFFLAKLEIINIVLLMIKPILSIVFV